MTVAASYAFCEGVARSQAKNFYLTFLLLSPAQRRAMCAIYAFMRYCDDLSDDAGIPDRASAIALWSHDLTATLAGHPPENPIWPAFADSVLRYKIPHQYFHAMIAGISSDLEPRRVQTFDQLYDYCYHVASVVGLTIIHIFGFESPDALQLAEKCGIAFQLTNILRDVREDAENDRIYLPEEDLARFAVAPASLRSTTLTPALRSVLEFEAARARRYFDESAPLVQMIQPGSRASLRALIGIYSRLLEKIVESGYDVMSQRVRVPTWEKMWILLRSRFG
ncbi:MAG: phytoene/squalene synthase family protein [Acidobacteriota bacterium]